MIEKFFGNKISMSFNSHCKGTIIVTSNKVYEIPPSIIPAYITPEKYLSMYATSITDPAAFWDEQAKKFIAWEQPWSKTLTGSLENGNVLWFVDGKLNACYNCVDRHLPQRANQIAIIWEGDEPQQGVKITYGELHQQVCRLADVLKKQGIKKGDRVAIYLPMIPEIIVSMLACARIGAIHSVIFAGFSPNAISERIVDADCRLIITADEGKRGGKFIPLKANVDSAITSCPNVNTVIVVKHTNRDIPWNPSRDHWYHTLVNAAQPNGTFEIMDANDPLFILYTSGSTGKPKGVVHSTGGYLVYATMTFHYIFDYHEGEILWCTADLGWVTGHSYSLYGPLANGATIVIFEGIPTYPNPARCWDIIDTYQVNIFYTAPTALRVLYREGDEYLQSTHRSSLRLLGVVGEPTNPAIWEWYYNKVGKERCPIIDTWWQTETGGILISPLPWANLQKPGSAAVPFFGIVPAILNDQGDILSNNEKGNLVITQPWPGQLQTIYGNHSRYLASYLQAFPGYYQTGDGAWRDADGYYWITGRMDDVVNVSGHRLGSAEIESALVRHPAVAEAAVVGFPHDLKGQGIYAYVVLMADIKPDNHLQEELIQFVRQQISPIATPDVIQWTTSLPKTRSGKIMRRILRKIAAHETEDLGDVSTLSNPEVLEVLIKDSQQVK